MDSIVDAADNNHGLGFVEIVFHGIRTGIVLMENIDLQLIGPPILNRSSLTRGLMNRALFGSGNRRLFTVIEGATPSLGLVF